MNKQHTYTLTNTWTGNRGTGTNDYREYDRSHTISADNKVSIEASSDPVFRGDSTKFNPEEFLLAALSSCHMLWYLHLCADNGVVVVHYIDNPIGTMVEMPHGGGHFTNVQLRPTVTVTDKTMVEKAEHLHEKAHEKCFIANSMNFTVEHQPTIIIESV
ncbi:MAG: OsmC family protein [Ignavibacteria bacterium]|nr:OsmC family protein [Ignavibacteria bacterium]